MTFKLTFLPQALKEWGKLDRPTQEQFKKKLKERLNNPIVPKDRLHGSLSDCYKIKLRDKGYRLVYQVNQKEISILVITVGRRDGMDVYKMAFSRR